MNQNRNTRSETDIEKVKHANNQSGMSYNEAKEYIARTTGGHNTEQFSDTNTEEIKQQLQNRNK